MPLQTSILYFDQFELDLYVRFRDIGEQGGGKTVVFGLAEGKALPYRLHGV